MTVRLASLACAVAVTVVSLESAAAVIKPGKEAATMALIQPFKDGGPVQPDAILAGVRIEQQRIVVILATSTEPKKTAEIGLIPLPATDRRSSGKAFAVKIVRGDDRLQAAVQTVTKAIRSNDDGSFFDDATPAADGVTATGSQQIHRPKEPVDPRDKVPIELEDGSFSLWQSWMARFGAIGWLVLGLALLVAAGRFARRMVLGPGRGKLLMGGLAVAFIFGSALTGRASLDVWPLHANNHAYEDIAAGLGSDGSGAAVQRHVVGYGATWLVAQRLATSAFGAHHDGLGEASAWAISAAVALAVVAALAGGGSWWLALLIGAAVSWLPITTHIGHSESTVAYAVFLGAATLLLATQVATWSATVGLVTALWLLANGHVVGPILAGGAALLCFGVSLPTVLAGSDGQPRGPGAVLQRVFDGNERRITLAWLIALVALPTIALVGRIASSSNEVGARLEAAGSLLPIPGNPFYFSLWLMETSPSAVLGLAIAGVAAVGVVEDERQPWHRRAAAIGAGVGFAAIAGAGLLVCACLTDGLRYQSTLAPPIIVCTAFAPRLAFGRSTVQAFAIRAFVVISAIVAVWTASDADLAAGDQQGIDAQTRAYHFLRRQLSDLRGEIWIVDAGRTSERGAVLHVPEGKLGRDGPTVHRLHVESFVAACAAGLPLPGPVYLFFDPACAIDASEDGLARPCKRLEPYADRDASGAYGSVKTAPFELRPKGLRGEFLDYGERELPWRFIAARCP